jgi:threonine dehydratase
MLVKHLTPLDLTMTELDLNLISQAAKTLSGHIRHTPVEPSPLLSETLGVPTWLKLEFLQRTGSFKLRGAFFRLATLDESERRRGVATCSAGNHGLGVAYAGQQLGIRVTVYVPETVDEAKYRAMVTLGAEVIRAPFPGFDESQRWALDAVEKKGQTFIHAFDDYRIMAGNGGTLAAEVLADVPEARTFILPVSGGGLSAGFAYYARAKDATARIIGCQHQDSPGLHLSLQRGAAVSELPPIDTVAGGIEGGLGEKPFSILKDRVNQVVLVSEVEIYQATRWLLDRHQYLVEPSAAVTIAACLSGKVQVQDGLVVVVLSGRNVSMATLTRILTETTP